MPLKVLAGPNFSSLPWNSGSNTFTAGSTPTAPSPPFFSAASTAGRGCASHFFDSMGLTDSRARRPRCLTDSRAHRPRRLTDSRARRPRCLTDSRARRPRCLTESHARRPRRLTESRARRLRRLTESHARRPRRLTESRARRPRRLTDSRAHALVSDGFARGLDLIARLTRRAL